jgi:hypothetical protein
MSSATVRNTSASSGPPLRFMAAAGLAAAAAQVIFLREYLTVFSGNELVIGLVFALWLLAAAAGSRAGGAFAFGKWRLLSFLYVVSVVLGVLLLRASRLLFLPGVVVPPWAVALIVLLTQSDAAFFGGLVYGRLARQGGGARLYLVENAGPPAFCSTFRTPPRSPLPWRFSRPRRSGSVRTRRLAAVPSGAPFFITRARRLCWPVFLRSIRFPSAGNTLRISTGW